MLFFAKKVMKRFRCFTFVIISFFKRASKRDYQTDKGGVFVEIILSLPLFLLCVFILMWAGFTYESKTALISAVNNGVRLAITRGQPELMRVEVIPEISSWDGSCPEAGNFPAPLVKYFVNGQVGGTLCQAYQALLKGVPPMCYPGSEPCELDNQINILDLDFKDAPDSYLYALVYVKEALKLSLGANNVRYPCDPRALDGSGCLRCVFEDIFDEAPINQEQMVLHCEYQPYNMLIRPINALLRIIAAKPFILYHAYYDNQDNQEDNQE